MLRVRIELLPFGDESKVTEIATGTITNDRTGSFEFGNYKFEFLDGNALWCRGEVKRCPRRHGNAWVLVSLALERALETLALANEEPQDV